MSLVRTALILSVAIAVLPSDRAQQDRVYQNVVNAADWTATYCDRNPATCENAGVMWQSFLAKAQFAGNVAYSVAMQYVTGGDNPTYASVQSQPVALGTLNGKRHGTLNSRDLEPLWRGANTKTAKANKGI